MKISKTHIAYGAFGFILLANSIATSQYFMQVRGLDFVKSFIAAIALSAACTTIGFALRDFLFVQRIVSAKELRGGTRYSVFKWLVGRAAIALFFLFAYGLDLSTTHYYLKELAIPSVNLGFGIQPIDVINFVSVFGSDFFIVFAGVVQASESK